MIGLVAERFRVIAFVVGCGLLFWQRAASPADWLFAAGVVASACIWERGAPAFDLANPQPLLLLFLTITASTTILADGSPRSFLIAAALVALTLALASTLRRRPQSIRAIEVAVVVAGCVAALSVFVGATADHIQQPILKVFSDGLRGIFKNADVAGAFVASGFPLAVGYGIRLRTGRGAFLALATAVFGIGVVSSYSPWALFLMALAVAVVIIALAILRERRLALAVGAGGVLLAGGIVASGFTLYVRQLEQSYERGGEIAAWRVGAQLFLDAPLGTGAGSFEPRANELFATGRSRWTAADSEQSSNLLRNGAADGLLGWTYDPRVVAVTALSDPTSVTGTATQKHTTAIYQDLAQSVPVTGGKSYAFAAQIRTDGTPAFLIVHWRDASDITISQAASDAVSATTWTEARLLAQAAPPTAKTVTVFLSNGAPGDQYFSAIRMVEGSAAPAWSSSMEWGTAQATAAQSTYLRLAVESGVPGLLTLCFYWLLLAWAAWRRGGTSWHWGLALTVALLAGVAIDTLDWRVLWVYAGVVAPAFSERRAARSATRRKMPSPAPLSHSSSISS